MVIAFRRDGLMPSGWRQLRLRARKNTSCFRREFLPSSAQCLCPRTLIIFPSRKIIFGACESRDEKGLWSDGRLARRFVSEPSIQFLSSVGSFVVKTRL